MDERMSTENVGKWGNVHPEKFRLCSFDRLDTRRAPLGMGQASGLLRGTCLTPTRHRGLRSRFWRGGEVDEQTSDAAPLIISSGSRQLPRTPPPLRLQLDIIHLSFHSSVHGGGIWTLSWIPFYTAWWTPQVSATENVGNCAYGRGLILLGQYLLCNFVLLCASYFHFFIFFIFIFFPLLQCVLMLMIIYFK